MNESITALLIGLATGVVILLISNGKSSHLLVFSEDLFFIYLLPPIIFNAGFQVKKKQFSRNFVTIMLFGAAGTVFKHLDIGTFDLGDYLAIGAIFAATDSVCALQLKSGDIRVLANISLTPEKGVFFRNSTACLQNATVKPF
ncbi:unnamed protein product [Microthlaspi erraticum]|uniref:Cation/H+ exchanger transmembrane domain-containing protein n=1 Tax=Microthlaspi erraticum TaxID=1685480 RepID=A0A6D2JEN4_9BRAS|nr:unnamed protein product [Microthlaspi erraticum]